MGQGKIDVANAARMRLPRAMTPIDGLRSPGDKSVAYLFHLGRMFDKMRLQQAGKLPEDFQRNYGLSFGLDGQLCGFLGVEFGAIEARLREGGTDAEIAEWIFAQGFRPNRSQIFVWNEYIRKLGWNDRATAVVAKAKEAAGIVDRPDLITVFESIDYSEGREPAPPR